MNDEQLLLKETINDFIKGQLNVFLVNGPGGTGKTFTICKSINPHIYDVVFLGATNKVTGIIRNNLRNNGNYNAPVKTIDSFFGFKMKKDHDNNTITSYRIPEELPAIIVIDECSMVNNRLTELLSSIKTKTKIILIGDDMQLPPVSTSQEREGIVENGFKKSKVFSLVEDTFTLTKVMRQKEGSELAEIVSGFRNHMDKQINLLTLADKKQNNKDIVYLDINSLQLKEVIKNDTNIAICYKNLTVLKYNWLIGSIVTNNNRYRVNSLNVGDVLYLNSFYKKEDIALYTSEFITVKQIEDYQGKFFDAEYTCFKLLVTRHDDSLDYVIFVSKGFKTTLSKIYNKLSYQRKTASDKRKAELNTMYSDFQLGLAQLKKPFAITCHKAQGSTYDNVIIPIYDYSNYNHKDVNQLFYVALSRAKKRVIFVNQPLQFSNNNNRINFTELERNSICSNYDYICQDCFKPFDDIRDVDIDHKIPISKGGKNEIDNLRPLCKTCHKLKTKYEHAIQH